MTIDESIYGLKLLVAINLVKKLLLLFRIATKAFSLMTTWIHAESHNFFAGNVGPCIKLGRSGRNRLARCANQKSKSGHRMSMSIFSIFSPTSDCKYLANWNRQHASITSRNRSLDYNFLLIVDAIQNFAFWQEDIIHSNNFTELLGFPGFLLIV